MRILLAEDDEKLNETLVYGLTQAGFIVDACFDGEDALFYGEQNIYDVILLDRMLPCMEGTDVLASLRKKGISTPVILITALGTLSDKVEGLDLGADDYLVKPFLPKELLLRVKAILKRAYPEKNHVVQLETAAVDLDQAEVIKNGQRIPLTAKEYSIFQKLADNAGHIVTIGLLCQAVCGEIWQGYETTLMTHIRHLREKIEENPSKPVSLLTMKGLGYKLLVKEPEK